MTFLFFNIWAQNKKKAVSFENGYQTWGGGMKNQLVFHTHVNGICSRNL